MGPYPGTYPIAFQSSLYLFVHVSFLERSPARFARGGLGPGSARFAHGDSCWVRGADRPSSRRVPGLFEKFLIDLLDFDCLFNPATDVVANHEAR